MRCDACVIKSSVAGFFFVGMEHEVALVLAFLPSRPALACVRIAAVGVLVILLFWRANCARF